MAEGRLTPDQTIKLKVLIELYAYACAANQNEGGVRRPFEGVTQSANHYLSTAKRLDSYLHELTLKGE